MKKHPNPIANPISLIGLVLSLSLVACAPEPRRETPQADDAPPVVDADDPDPVVARINSTSIRRSAVVAESLAQSGGSADTAPEMGSPEFDRVLEELVNQRLLALEARNRGLHQSPEAQRRITNARERILANVMLETALDDAVSEDVVRRIYEEQIRLIPRAEEVRARHILVATREEADQIKALLDAGESFAELAVRVSLDRATRLEGGDLGYFTRDGILDVFGAVAFATAEGEISDPFSSEFGWHVLTVLDRRREPPPSLEALRPQITRFSTFDEVQELMTELRSDADILLYDLSRPDVIEEDGETGAETSDEPADEAGQAGEPG